MTYKCKVCGKMWNVSLCIETPEEHYMCPHCRFMIYGGDKRCKKERPAKSLSTPKPSATLFYHHPAVPASRKNEKEGNLWLQL